LLQNSEFPYLPQFQIGEFIIFEISFVRVTLLEGMPIDDVHKHVNSSSLQF